MLAARGVSVRYPGTADAALEAIDLQLGGGELLVVAGPNGSGKTTLQRALLGLAPLFLLALFTQLLARHHQRDDRADKKHHRRGERLVHQRRGRPHGQLGAEHHRGLAAQIRGRNGANPQHRGDGDMPWQVMPDGPYRHAQPEEEHR